MWNMSKKEKVKYDSKDLTVAGKRMGEGLWDEIVFEEKNQSFDCLMC